MDITYSDLLQMQNPVRYDETNSQCRGGSRHISAVLPAISACLGNPIATPVHPRPWEDAQKLGLPEARSIIIVLVDGMGFWNLSLRKGHAPYLRSLLQCSENSNPISTCYPSTTVAAMATFGTGTCPGLTSMTGYTQLNSITNTMSQLIQFTNAIAPEKLQTQPTIFEQLSAAGTRVTSVGLTQFAASALTRAAFRGANYLADNTANGRIAKAVRAAQQPGLTYLYLRDIDKTGHHYGWDSNQWTSSFESIDNQLASLRRQAPKGTLIVITADHGMVNSNPATRIDIAEHSELMKGVAFVGGEPRATMLYAQEGTNPVDIAQRYKNILGENAVVRTKEEALSLGIYGEVSEKTLPMLGDVLVSAADETTLVDTRIQKDLATRMPSVHGSMTAMELDIPLLMDMA